MLVYVHWLKLSSSDHYFKTLTHTTQPTKPTNLEKSQFTQKRDCTKHTWKFYTSKNVHIHAFQLFSFHNAFQCVKIKCYKITHFVYSLILLCLYAQKLQVVNYNDIIPLLQNIILVSSVLKFSVCQRCLSKILGKENLLLHW